MTLRPRRLVLLFGLVPTLIVSVLSLGRPAFLTSLEYSVYDAFLRASEKHAPIGQVVIVDIDDRSLSAVGQWPWRRDVLGQLIIRLRDLGAAVVALDVIFAESDRQEGPAATTDVALAETIRAGRVVLGYAMTFDTDPGGANGCARHPLGLAIMRRGDDASDPFFQASSAICNLPILAEAAETSGFLNAAPDHDGILRRAPLLLQLDGRVYPSLALSIVTAIHGVRADALRVANANTSTLMVGNLNVPLDGQSNLLLRYRGVKRTFPYVSAVEVLRGQRTATTFKDKIVLVGTTALGTREVVSTPLDTLFAGVEVQATVADNLLQQDFLRRPEHGIALETQILIGFGILAAWIVGRFGLVWGALGVAACLTAVWTGTLSLMSSSGIFLSPLYPVMGLTAALASMTAAWFTIERGRAKQAGQEKVTSQRLMVQSLLSLTEVRDSETGKHSRRTQQYTRVLAEQLATHPQFKAYLTRERIELLASLAPLHDIGKVGVPDNVLNKPGALTPEELVEMRKHPGYGHDVILHAQQEVGVKDDAILSLAKDIVYTHHEKWDGTGYPQGLRGNQIPIPGRVMAIVDVYDASTTRRLYRPSVSHDDAVALIVKGRGTHFDPDVVDAFVKVSGVFRELASSDH